SLYQALILWDASPQRLIQRLETYIIHHNLTDRLAAPNSSAPSFTKREFSQVTHAIYGKRRTVPPTVQVGNVTHTDMPTIERLTFTHFKNQVVTRNPFDLALIQTHFRKQHRVPVQDPISLSPTEIEEIIDNLPLNSSPGPDGIPNECWQKVSDSIS